MSEFLLRPARPDEADAVGALTVAGYDADGHLTKSDGTYDRGYAEWLADVATRSRDGVLLVAVDGETLLGTVTWCPPGSPFREVATGDHQGEIRTLSVGPESRGRRVGSALVDWCIAEARRDGLTEIVLSSLPEMHTAHRLYQSRGFTRAPELDWTFDDIDLWGFRLTL